MFRVINAFLCVHAAIGLGTITHHEIMQSRVSANDGIIFRNISVGGVWAGSESVNHPGFSPTGITREAEIGHALRIAQEVITHHCNTSAFRIAPLVFSDLGEGTLMQAWAPYVLLNVPSMVPQLDSVFVPISLARHLLDTGVATDTNIDSNWILNKTDYDIHIEVSKSMPLMVGDSGCDLVGSTPNHFSAITTFIHEIIHGMGIQSHISATHGGGISTYNGVSIYDGLMYLWPTDGSPQRPLFRNDHDVNSTTALDITGELIKVADQTVYNPRVYERGSSLHHLEAAHTVMSAYIERNKCKFRLSDADVVVMNAMGWQCVTREATHDWDHTLFIDAVDTHHTSAHCSCTDEHGYCKPCEEGDILAGILFITFILFSFAFCYYMCFVYISKPTCPPVASTKHAFTPIPIQSIGIISYTPVSIGTNDQ